MKKQNLILTFVFLFPLFVSAQYLEAGLWGGGATYMGDLSPEKGALSTGSYHYAGGAFLRYNYSELFTAKLAMSYGHIGANDAVSSNPGRQSRGLNFRSPLFETSLTGEINVFGYESQYMSRRFSPYVFMGISWFHFNPKGRISGVWHELQPLGTEGQGLAEFPMRQPYKLSGFAIPMGGGLKFAVNDKINLGAEIGMRKTFTDYLDDVSQTYAGDDLLTEYGKDATLVFSNRSGQPKTSTQNRGNAEYDDWYIFGGFSISMNLNNSGGNIRPRRRAIGCPTF